MGVRDYQVPESFVKTLRRHLSGFMTLDPVHQVRMAHFIWNAGSRARAHDTLEGCTSFGYQELENAFGRGEFARLNNLLGIFDVTQKWSKVNHKTKGYRLSALVLDIKDRFLSDGSPITTSPARFSLSDVCGTTAMLSMNARPIVTLPNVLASKDIRPQTTSLRMLVHSGMLAAKPSSMASRWAIRCVPVACISVCATALTLRTSFTCALPRIRK